VNEQRSTSMAGYSDDARSGQLGSDLKVCKPSRVELGCASLGGHPAERRSCGEYRASTGCFTDVHAPAGATRSWQ